MGVRSAVTALVAVGTILGTAGPASASVDKAHGTTTTSVVNVATDRTTAQSINLTAADLPGWQESPNPPDSGGQGFDTKMTNCVGKLASGYSGNDDVVDVSSANFDKGAVELSSDVTMVRSHADGLSDLAAFRSLKLQGCFQKIFPPLISQGLPGAKVSKLKVALFKPKESLPNSFGFRLSVTVHDTQQGVTISVPVDFTIIGFLVGRAEVSLSEVERSHGAVAIEAALVHTLDTRAQSSATT
jgi:hypothetical protein